MDKFFKSLDKNTSGSLELHEFTQAVLDLQLNITEEDIHSLFSLFDQNCNGLIEYKEFCSFFKNSLSATRYKIIERVFQSIDK